MRIFRIAALLLSCVSLSAVAQNCTVTDNAEYTRQIREYTTDKAFSTELVDHLPASSCVPSPDQFLHHIIGAPNVLDHVADINAYMRLLASKSPRVKVFSIGKSEEGREMLLVAVSDEQTIQNLDHYREITAKLADPRQLSDADADKLIAEGKPMYWADGSIHSPETGSPEMLMELAYRLAVEETPFIQEIRKNSIVLITPVVEVDGRDREVDIYMHHVHHPDDPQYPLTWWGHYVSHDNNRDNLGMGLDLSHNMLHAYLDWHPTVMHDLHESIPYLYIMTGTGPYNAWLDPIVISEWQEMAYHEIEELTKRGVIGVWTHGFFDGWAPNYLLSIANNHNSVGRFYETFGNGGADTRTRELGPSDTSREWYRPNPPLPKVKWSARNNINMQESAILFGMNRTAQLHEKFLRNFYLKSKRAVAKARMEGPAAWVFPADDTRPEEQASFLNLLAEQGIEVQKLEKATTVPAEYSSKPATNKEDTSAPATTGPAQKTAGKAAPKGTANAEAKETPTPKEFTFPAGSYVIRMDQPYSRLADMILDTQYYNPKDPRSYDDTGWTLGALHNVKTTRVVNTSILDAPMQKVAAPFKAPGGVRGTGNLLVINNNTDNTLATFRYRFANLKMEAAEQPFELDGQKFNAGSFLIREGDRNQIDAAAKELGLVVHAAGSAPNVPMHELAAPRIAIVHNWQSTQNDGWFRIALDDLKVPYTYIADTKLRVTPNLRQQFDVIIVPPMGGFGPSGLSSILRGLPMRGGPMPWKNTEEMPNLVAQGLDSSDDIRGGLGFSGLENLDQFVRDGGLLMTVQGSDELPVAGGMTDMVNVNPPRQMNAPGGVYLASVEDKGSPVAYGYGDKLYTYFHIGPVLSVGMSFGGPGGGGQGGPTARASGRGSLTDPDVIQARPYTPPEPEPHRTPRERELYIPDEVREYAKWLIPPPDQVPRVILRFAPIKDLLLSGM
ncbi:MAG TPA: M14 family zinc carboxypeptidase, partial [Terriglobales bacterium]|nr:M14 family zinc carboxypeptidase [Terriglobales bacterium]